MICWQLLRLVKVRFCEFHQGTFAPVAMVFIMRPAAIGMVVALLFSIYMSFKVQKQPVVESSGATNDGFRQNTLKTLLRLSRVLLDL